MSLFKTSGAPCPPRRLLIQPSATSPFCTSPSQLQEVTLDPDATNFSYFGMRSPGAITNCRSVKEIDEQLTNLRKENFNLKLRIYFLEERMGANYNTDKEDAIKKNIELMVELENVRKDLEDKQELLCQAAKAMEIEEEERKREVMERDQEIADLKEALAEIRNQLDSETHLREEKKELALCAQAFNLDLNECKTTDIVKKLQSTITDLQAELKKERGRADHLESIAKLAEKTQTKCNHLESEVRQKESKINNYSFELEGSKKTMMSYSQRIGLLEEELKQKTGQLQEALAELRQKDRDLKEHMTEIKELNQLYESAEQQKDKQERKAEKYKTLLIQCENKNHDMLNYIENLRSTIHSLEMRLETAVDEVKKTNKNKTETVIKTDQKLKSSYTDVDLFSVRTPFPVPETPKSSKISPTKINSRSPKSVHTKNSSIKSKNNNSSGSPESISSSPPTTSINNSNKKNISSEISCEVQPSNNSEELLELKKNHVKACKMIKALIQRKSEYVEQIEKLQTTVAERSSEIRILQEKIDSLTTDCDDNNSLSVKHKKKSLQEMVSEMHLTATPNPAATNKETSMADEEVQLAEQYKELVNELEIKIEVLKATLNEKDDQLEQIKIELQSKANRIIDLEFELLTLNQGVNNNSVDMSGDKEGAVEKLLQEQEEKEKEIKRLDSELRKRTCDLQGIVNKELWEKNRSIEKLQIILKSKDEEINKLEKDVFGKELQLKVLKDKINELGIHINLAPGSLNTALSSDMNVLQDQLRACMEERKHYLQEIENLQEKLKNTLPEHDENQEFLQLQTEYKDLREELEKSEKLRQESQEICTVLSTRLEELCYFLDSLLKHKSVLGFLGNEQVRKMQIIIDKSFDLSRTLSSTISLNPDQSLLQLTNITNLLNSTRNDSLNFNNDFLLPDEENNAVLSIIPSDVTLTYQSHLNRAGGVNEQAEVITVLRQQIANLKREIVLRDVELGKKLTNNVIEEGIKPLENEEEFVDALVDLQPQNVTPEGLKLNVTSSTLIAEKSSTTLKNCNIENQSESESWSEPDRTVSMARIGLHDESLKRPGNASLSRRTRLTCGSNLSTESTEEDFTASSAKTPSKRGTLAESRQTIISLHEQVCELEMKLKEKENEVLAAQVAFYETDNLLKQEQAKVEESLRTNLQLSMQIMDTNKKLSLVEQQKYEAEQKMKTAAEEHARLSEQIKETNKKLDEAEKRKYSAEQKILELQQIIATLEEFRRNIETTMDIKNKETQNQINHMEVEKAKAIAAAENAEKLLEKAKIDMQIAETQLQNMHKREQELENKYNDNLKKAEEQYVNNVKTIERNYEAQAKKCREAVVQIQEGYEKEYIKKSEVDKRILEVEEITKEVENLRTIIQDCQKKMHEMEEREMELKNKAQDLQREHHERIHELRKELDSATLQYSQEILEKTRLKNETTQLEQKVQKFYTKESELIQEVKNLHKEFQEAQSNLQMQVSQLEHQKSVLDVKVTNLEAVNAELQSSNAELRNRLVKIQIGKNIGEVVSSSTSLPNNPGNILSIHANRTLPISIQSVARYSRQLSDHSGYTSEDIPVDESALKSITDFAHLHVHTLLREIDNERVQANSSPDLGIESDHGRFSSLEANVNIPRPLLPTLELTESMSNLLDPVQDVSCINDQCCKKTKQMANENVELRKRLLRTRRALEETLNRLTVANKQKKEVEKSICKQIHKTSQVLRRAKANLDSGSETDILNK